MGWEAAESVVHEHVDGLLVGSRVTREPEWDDEQRSLALALIDLERETGPHGIPMWDALNPTAEDPNGDFRFVVDEPLTDYAARAVARAEKAYREKHGKDVDMTGLIFAPRKVEARDR